MSRPDDDAGAAARLEDMRGAWAQTVATGTSDVTGRGTRWLMAGGVVFLVWSLVFPLKSAVVAEGSVVATGQNKVVQHRTGGVVREIMVRDGDDVSAGQEIMALDPVNDQAELTRLKGRLAVLQATRTRLQAENEDAEGLVVTSALKLRGGHDVPGQPDMMTTASTASGVETLLAEEQQREFQRGRQAVRAEVDSLLARMDALERRRQGLSVRAANGASVVAMLERQADAMRPLAQAGHIARKSLWDAEQELLARRSELEGLRAEESALPNEIAETRARITQARMTDQRMTSGRLTEVIAEIAQISDQLRAAESAVAAASVKAPASGTLLHMKHTTIGAVAAPGEVLAQIVPIDAELTFRTRVSPADIAYVHAGQSARARITALNARLYDDVPGVVSLVPADSTLDERTGQHYYAVEVKLENGPSSGDGRRIVGPGMMGEVFIDGDARTFASYLFKPIGDSLARSFREH